MRRGRHALILLALLICGVSGCPRKTTQAPALRVELSFEPSPPAVGPVQVTASLAHLNGVAVDEAKVLLEGNMNHAGMKPSFSTLEQIGPGRYAGMLEFTMGGDWFILLTATLEGGAIVTQTIDVPGVRVP